MIAPMIWTRTVVDDAAVEASQRFWDIHLLVWATSIGLASRRKA